MMSERVERESSMSKTTDYTSLSQLKQTFRNINSQKDLNNLRILKRHLRTQKIVCIYPVSIVHLLPLR